MHKWYVWHDARIGTLEDVASVGLFLASNAAKHLKGEIIDVDGGVVIK